MANQGIVYIPNSRHMCRSRNYGFPMGLFLLFQVRKELCSDCISVIFWTKNAAQETPSFRGWMLSLISVMIHISGTNPFLYYWRRKTLSSKSYLQGTRSIDAQWKI